MNYPDHKRFCHYKENQPWFWASLLLSMDKIFNLAETWVWSCTLYHFTKIICLEEHFFMNWKFEIILRKQTAIWWFLFEIQWHIFHKSQRFCVNQSARHSCYINFSIHIPKIQKLRKMILHDLRFHEILCEQSFISIWHWGIILKSFRFLCFNILIQERNFRCAYSRNLLWPRPVKYPGSLINEKNCHDCSKCIDLRLFF